MYNNRQQGRDQVKVDDKRKMWVVGHHFQGSSLTSQALKTSKVTHFQRITYWKQPRVIRQCPHDFITALTLCSTFNSVRKVTEVSGQSVAHLNWLTATCCFKCSQTQSATALYWQLQDTSRLKCCSLIKVCFISDNGNDSRDLLFHTRESFWCIFFLFFSKWEGLELRAAVLRRIPSHLVTARITRDVIPSELSKALLW